MNSVVWLNDDHDNDNGFVLLFSLIMIFILSSMTWACFNNFRLFQQNFNIWRRHDHNVTRMMESEYIAEHFLERVDLNLYRELKALPRGEPVALNMVLDDGLAQVEINSMNNCVNIQLPEYAQYVGDSKLASVLKALSQSVTGNVNQGEQVYEALLQNLHKSPDNNLESTTLSFSAMDAQNNLSDEQHEALQRLSPWLCLREKPGQKIDLNSINAEELPALYAILSPVSPHLISRALQRKGQQNWASVNEFTKALGGKLISDDQINMLSVESSDFSVTYKTNDTLFSISHFSLKDDGHAEQTFRRMLNDGSY
ncbi:hypothetical protein RE130_004922 [Klebsiella aerogenes]|nr:general secretion pathway protein GspK [Klebsiella aerogenes]EKZ6676766.1 general secretion pathway protein GspK [Klebsiella aerogenes]